METMKAVGRFGVLSFIRSWCVEFSRSHLKADLCHPALLGLDGWPR
jgi:hypothetical protein